MTESSAEEKKQEGQEELLHEMRVVLAGGGSGGHIYPLLAVVESLREMAAEKMIEPKIYYLGPKGEEVKILESAKVSIYGLAGGKWRRYAALQNLLDIPRFFVSFFQSLWKLFWIMPDVIFSKGGSGSLPVVLVGWFYRIPILVHESDIVPGLSNAIAGKFATRVAVSFEKAKYYFSPKKTAVTGSPLRPILFKNIISPADAKESLGFDPKKPLLLVLGGSQGAQALNNFVVTNLAELTEIFQVFHQTGTANIKEVESLSRAALAAVPGTEPHLSYHPRGYLTTDQMKLALEGADLVLTRGGSNTLFEIAAFGKPAIIIPLPGSARDHQRLNAYEFSERGGGLVIEQANLIPDIFFEQLEILMSDSAKLQEMGAAARSFFTPNASQVLANELIVLSGKTS
ncbi:MAG: UDP-N-acetylglucosamine--N-acetylmuramyl-(pentapeptide) pyrophosphoryl-undecaprenol N-acetylglucosamine transferase [Anaplasmataceae bacterium]|nr:UDP-N-acetylglucosamine--N-acetylmuramyl-(pentapeptide) pyrophosphoryl-undecaprenol N-acetylglucosamine transferase [Anaplasmataceae bacterium]